MKKRYNIHASEETYADINQISTIENTSMSKVVTQLVQKYFEDNGRQENTLYAKTEQKILTDLINAANPLTVDMLKRRYGKVVSKIMLEGEGYKFSIDEQGRATVTTYKLKAGEIAYIKK